MILDELYTQTASVERPLREHEPPSEINRGYIDLLFAYGYRQLGDAARSNELGARGRALIAPHLDEVHAWVLAAFEARLGGAEMPPVDDLERVTRYKVDRFREASQVIGGGESIDAIGRFAGGPPTVLSASHLDAMDRAFDTIRTADDQDMAEALVDHILQVEPQPVPPTVFDRVLRRIPQVHERRCVVLARLVALAAHAAPERVPALISELAPLLADRSWDLGDILFVLVRALATRHQAELALVLEHTPEHGRSTAAYRLGQLRLGAPVEIADLVRGDAKDLPPDRELLRVALDAVLARPEPFGGGWVGAVVANTTDSLGTSSHFTFTLVEVVDRIVRAAVVANQ